LAKTGDTAVVDSSRSLLSLVIEAVMLPPAALMAAVKVVAVSVDPSYAIPA
jgi:hypothetical protein